jgi:hypothetical protein
MLGNIGAALSEGASYEENHMVRASIVLVVLVIFECLIQAASAAPSESATPPLAAEQNTPAANPFTDTRNVDRPAAKENNRPKEPSADVIFSGPQIGERLPPLPVRGVLMRMPERSSISSRQLPANPLSWSSCMN